MQGRVKRLLLKNLLLKIVSVGLAVFLFYMVRVEKQSLAYGTVQVSFTAPAGKILVSDTPQVLQLSVLGPSSRIQRFRFEDVADVNVDLSSVRAGFLKFEPEMVRLPPGFKVASIRPAGFTVRFAGLIERDIPIKATVQGQVAEGFRVARSTTKPAKLHVSGPEATIRGLTEARTSPVVVEGGKNKIVARVTLLPMPAKVDVKLPDMVEVSVEIVPLTPVITLSHIPVVVDDPLQRRLQLQPSQVEVTVEGPPQVLANLSRNVVAARVVVTKQDTGRIRRVPQITGLGRTVIIRKITPAEVVVDLGVSEGTTRKGAR